MDDTAFNYDDTANTACADCCEAVVEGCMFEDAFNYNSDANTACADCCEVVVEGCTDDTAFNYNADAKTDDGSSIAVVEVVWLEWYRVDFQPLLEVAIDPTFFPFIRAASTFFTLSMTTAVLYSFHKDLNQARADLQVAFLRSENLLLNILPFSIAK